MLQSNAFQTEIPSEPSSPAAIRRQIDPVSGEWYSSARSAVTIRCLAVIPKGGPLEASRKEILKSEIGPNEIHLYHPGEIVGRTAGTGGEWRNFLDGVKSGKPCYAPAETGHRTITIAHIGNIAMLLGRKLHWNPDAERFVDDAQADGMLHRKQREPGAIENIDKWVRQWC